MNLPKDTVLAPEKFYGYLLKKLPDNDKSNFLSIAGYTATNWKQLANDIRTQLLPLAAHLIQNTQFGNMYEIRGVLSGPNGKNLNVVSVWMIELESRVAKFITLYPDKGK